MKRILRFFGLVPVDDVIAALNKEAEFYWDLRKNCTAEDIRYGQTPEKHAHYAQCCLDLKALVHLLNKE
jgi:hypothetical protein